ncbi:FAD-dependent oxidoreductase [Tistrella sp. BH-R2-4]|uniref:FAD-dependent oxidoreductase n=1 Tax=Tistrella arctica TaxID=3133430 RepID=A0ABU9YFC3_9PROT
MTGLVAEVTGPTCRRALVVGAGIAGLAAALDLAEAGLAVEIVEAAPGAGGRCRSFDDRETGRRLDNGTHVLLGANPAALDFVRRVGGRFRMLPPVYPVVVLDAPGGDVTRRLHLDLDRPLAALRAIGAGTGDLAALLRLVVIGGRNGRIGHDHSRLLSTPCGRLLLGPLIRAALNIDAADADTRLVRRLLGRLALAGPAGLRLYLAEGGLDAALIAPALARLGDLGASLRAGAAVDRLPEPAADQAIILAVPPAAAKRLLPALRVPEGSSAILNLHYALPAGVGTSHLPDALMVVGGLADWIFHRDGILSITTSAADDRVGDPAERLAAIGWAEIRNALGADAGLPRDMPPVRVVKEKRATMRHDPAGEARRPPPGTSMQRQVYLAGDWTDTGLPATIEGAVLSGRAAARAVLTGR